MTSAPQIPIDRPLRFALVGCGRIASNHFAALALHAPHAELVAVCATDPQHLARAMAKSGAPGFRDIDALLAGSDADAIVLTAPIGLHARHAIKAARAGRHVVGEKPMATKFEDGQAMIRACP